MSGSRDARTTVALTEIHDFLDMAARGLLHLIIHQVAGTVTNMASGRKGMTIQSSRPSKKPASPRRGRIAKRGSVKRAASGHHNICRQERSAKTVPGWKVALQRRSKYMHRYFSDKKYGGKAKALEAAKSYRDSLMAVADGVEYVLWRRNKIYPHNTSGIVGVGRYVVRYGKKKQPVWDAFWEGFDGKRHGRRFFVLTHGERRAKALACEARREAMEELRQEVIRRGRITA
jgi:hypothetical protein